ncbi:MAG: glutamyl-tRNA reductase, partial [Chloroflexi bacterium]|nr:glutamyl-tRNA reductase [Chloroflexota bacterium]
HVILSHAMIADVMQTRVRPLCVVDLGLPRNVEPSVAQIDRVHLVDLDELHTLAAQHLDERRAEVCKVQALVHEESANFWRWLQSLAVAPTVAALRDHAEQIRRSELEDHFSRLQNLSAHERRVIETMTASIVGRLLHEPTRRLKQRASDGDGVQYAAALRELFGLDKERDAP